jgi:ABC-2 type transport system ATP-binding protein
MSGATEGARASAPVSVEVSGLNKWYGDFKAVDEVSFQIHAGEIVGFLGPNGAGKSTTMKILTCFLGATSGSAKVAGYDVAEQSLEVRRRVGYLPETVPLYREMLVYDYLKFIAEMRGVPSGEIHRRIKETADVCGLSHMINRPIGELSKGYRQRVGLAQALIHKPEVVILDEPTSGLDPNQIIEIRDLIKEIGKEKTIIFSTHILQEVSAVCDRILLIDKGKLVADGTVDDLERKVRQEERYTVTFGATSGELPSEGELNQRLRKLAGVSGVEPIKARPREASFFVRGPVGTDLRHEIFGLASAQGLALLGLHRQALTLEDIFRTLTGDAARAAAESRARVAQEGM